MTKFNSALFVAVAIAAMGALARPAQTGGKHDG